MKGKSIIILSSVYSYLFMHCNSIKSGGQQATAGNTVSQKAFQDAASNIPWILCTVLLTPVHGIVGQAHTCHFHLMEDHTLAASQLGAP